MRLGGVRTFEFGVVCVGGANLKIRLCVDTQTAHITMAIHREDTGHVGMQHQWCESTFELSFNEIYHLIEVTLQTACSAAVSFGLQQEQVLLSCLVDMWPCYH